MIQQLCAYGLISHLTTVKFLKIQTPKKFAAITLKFEQKSFTIE